MLDPFIQEHSEKPTNAQKTLNLTSKIQVLNSFIQEHSETLTNSQKNLNRASKI